MSKQSKPDFADYIYSYFMKYLPLQRGLSPNTISSYSCSLMLLYQFCKSERGIPYEKLSLDRIDKQVVDDYLLWLEASRNNSAATRNQRLSALKSLFQYIRSESVVYTALCCDILSIPEKKTPTAPLNIYLLEKWKCCSLCRISKPSMAAGILFFYCFFTIPQHALVNWLSLKLEIFPLGKLRP